MTIYFHYIFGENAIKESGSLYGEFRTKLNEFQRRKDYFYITSFRFNKKIETIC